MTGGHYFLIGMFFGMAIALTIVAANTEVYYDYQINEE